MSIIDKLALVENTYDDFDRLTTENITLDNNLNDIRQKDLGNIDQFILGYFDAERIGS